MPQPFLMQRSGFDSSG